MIEPPKISLALPVYNGERYLESCISSILNQTFREFELVISDNASTDSTLEIAQYFSDRDDRIRIVRQNTNVGAARNFNLLFDETKADLFKWCAYDDRLDPQYLEATYLTLKQDPTAVVCHSHTVIHNLDNDEKEVFKPNFFMSPTDRVSRLQQMLLHGARCYEVFGLMRREALEKTGLIGNYRGGDNVLLYQLALLGNIAIVPKPLFILGRHSTQSTVMVSDTKAYHAWFQGRSAESITFPDWVYLRESWKITKGLSLSFYELLGCYKELLGETLRRRRALVRNLRVAAETLIFGSSDPLKRKRIFKSTKH